MSERYRDITLGDAIQVTYNENMSTEAINADIKRREEGVLASAYHPDKKTNAQKRKAIPVASGFLNYFPLAVLAVAQLSQKGNDQHNPGEPLHWAREKSGDEADAMIRHLLDDFLASNENVKHISADEQFDEDGILHLTKTAWRAMGNLQKRLEELEWRPTD